MSTLKYSRGAHTITLYASNGDEIDHWTAYNNRVAGADPFPIGTHNFSWHSPHPGGTANSTFGQNGNFIFEVPGRMGMGVHSGRANAVNNPGPQHKTEGCIRTTDEATKTIKDTHENDLLTRSVSEYSFSKYISPYCYRT